MKAIIAEALARLVARRKVVVATALLTSANIVSPGHICCHRCVAFRGARAEASVASKGVA
jgi:hypothetical protein